MTLMSATLLVADDGSKMNSMAGWICNNKCVVQSGEKATCDKTCTEKDGEAVFVDDKGAVTKIANQSKVTADTGKHGKMKYKMDKDQMMEAYSFEIAEPTY